MKTISKTIRHRLLTLAGAAGAVAAVLVACDNSPIGPSSSGDPDPGFNAAGGYDGGTKGGLLPENPGGGDDASPDPVDAETRCCIVTVSIPDATGDETVHVVRGSFYPLNTPEGVKLTYASCAWSANVCFPVASSATYYFDFGFKWLPGFEPDDAGPSDAGPSDASADASIPDATTDGAATDAGAADASMADASTEPPPGMTHDYRYNEALESAFSGDFGRVNTFAQVSSCGEVDASTGTLPVPP